MLGYQLIPRYHERKKKLFIIREPLCAKPYLNGKSKQVVSRKNFISESILFMVFSAKVFFSKVLAGSGKSEPYPQIKNGSLHSIPRVGKVGKRSENVGLSAHTTLPRLSEDTLYIQTKDSFISFIRTRW